jgi:RNA polymerase sigma factor (sigma-70 family)
MRRDGLDEPAGEIHQLQAAATLERAGLVRLCARLTGNLDAAEDLAQETLFEAWRNAHKLRDPDKRPQWLAGIARHVCLRWSQRRGKEVSLRAATDADADPLSAEELPNGDIDLAVELERHELADLLDRAMALLPPDTRSALVQHYMEESPQAEIAARLGMSENAVELRLRRGRLALRRVLTTDLIHEVAPYGFVEVGSWQETRIWCPLCGQSRLLSVRSDATLAFRCPVCSCGHGTNLGQSFTPEVFGDVKGFKATLNRLMRHASEWCRGATAAGAAPCDNCGRLLPLQPGPPPDTPSSLKARAAVHTSCHTCGLVTDLALGGFVLSLPEGRRFWREHPRMRALPEREIEAQGTSAVVTSFESVTESARLEVVAARDTFEIVGIHASPAGAMRA